MSYLPTTITKKIQIDGLSLTATSLFVNNTLLDFYITTLNYYPITQTGATNDGTFNIGVNATDYDSEISGADQNPIFQELYSNAENTGIAKHYISPSETLYHKILSTDSSASELTYFIVIAGYYL